MFDRLSPHRPIDGDRPIDASLRLDDGSRYRIRPSGIGDRAFLAACFDGLSQESRRMRFFNNKGALTPGDLDLFSGADGYDHIALAAVRIDASDQEVEPLGFARCLRLAPGGESAELSITVSDRFQGQGIGSALLDHLIRAAQAQGIRRFRFEVLVENRGMRGLAQKLGGDARWLGDGIVEYNCALPDPVPGAPVWDLPWYLDPGAWIAAWIAPGTVAWQTNLEHCLAWVRAANEDLHHRLDVGHRPAQTDWSDAA